MDGFTLISPLEELLRFFFEHFVRWTGNYGFSILLLSFTVSCIMFPLFLLADKIQEMDQKEKEVMADELDYIRCSVPNSQERYFYTRYVYARHGYYPIRSLRSLLGLLIQIPFFIAAYAMLGHYPGFSGQSFGLIRDLGQPDHLILNTFHLLPILMTAINILSSWCFLQTGGHKHSLEKNYGAYWQLFGISILFLVLLYTNNAALVLYWTMNNIFSLIKNLLKNWKYIRKYLLFQNQIFWVWFLSYVSALGISLFHISQVGYGLPRNGEILQLILFSISASAIYCVYKSYMYNYSELNILKKFPNAKRAYSLLYFALICFIGFQILLYLTEGRAHWYRYPKEISTIITVVWFFFLLCKLLLLFLWNRPQILTDASRKKARLYHVILYLYIIPAWILSLLYLLIQESTPGEIFLPEDIFQVFQFLSTCITIVYILILYHNWQEIKKLNVALIYFYFIINLFCNFIILGMNMRLFLLLFGAAQFIIILLLTFKLLPVLLPNILRLKIRSIQTTVFLFSLALFYLINYIENPILVYSSDPDNFSYTLNQIFPAIILWGIGITVFFLLIYLVRPFRSFLLYSFIPLVFSSWVYSYMYLPYIGKMEGVRFEDLAPLYRSISGNLLELFVFMTLCYAVVWLIRYKIKTILAIQIIAIVMILGKSIHDYNLLLSAPHQSISYQNDPQQGSQSTEDLLPAGYAQNLAFSQTEENILVVLFDGFTGPLAEKIFREYPDIADLYKGFIYYRNNITASAPTFGSMLSILEGKDFEPEKFHARKNQDRSITMRNSYDAAYNFVPDILQKEGYQVYHHINFVFANPQKMDFAAGYDGDYVSYWRKKNHIETILPPKSFSENLIFRLALFKSAPLFLKPVIYNNGDWLALESLLVASRKDRNLISSRRAYQTAGQRLALFDSFWDLANADSPSKTYKFIHLQTSHGPFSIDEDLNYRLLDNTYEELHDFPYAYYSLVYTLKQFGEWLAWFQSNGIYDNTKIILTADHGWWLSTGQSQYNRGISTWKTLQKPEDQGFYLSHGIVTSLLMVKDFRAAGSLQYSDHPMISSDIPYLTTPNIPNSDMIYREIDTVRTHFTYAFVQSSGDYMNYNLGIRYDIEYRPEENKLYYRQKNSETSFGEWRLLLSHAEDLVSKE